MCFKNKKYMSEKMTEPITKPYDTDVTLLYKWAGYYKVPLKLMIVRKRTEEDVNVTGTDELVFVSLSSLISDLVDKKYDLIRVYNEIVEQIPDMPVEDIVMSYYDAQKRILVTIKDEAIKKKTIAGFLEEINDFYSEFYPTAGDRKKFDGERDLNIYYDAWIGKITEAYNDEADKLNTIESVQGYLETLYEKPHLEVSPVAIKATTVAFKPTKNGKQVGIEDGYDIFNHSILSQYVPYIHYNGATEEEKFSKIFRGRSFDREPDYKLITVTGKKTRSLNTIFMKLWLGNLDGNEDTELHEATKESFKDVVYYLDSNFLKITSPVETKEEKIQDEKIAIERVQKALANLDLGKSIEIKVSGELDVYDVPFHDLSLVDMILTESLFNIYLYMEENKTPYSKKKRIDVHYKSLYQEEEEEEEKTSNLSAVSATLIPKMQEVDFPIEVLEDDGSVTKKMLPANTPYIHLNITKADSRKAISEFTLIFRLLMKHYKENYEEIEDLYLSFIPEIETLTVLEVEKEEEEETEEVKETKKKGMLQEKGRIYRLREKVPDLFISKYARRCQNHLLPIIINPDEEEEWKKRTFMYKGKVMERQIMKFPPDFYEQKQWNYVCPNDAAPFPGTKTNTMANKAKYECMPCCYKEDQMDPKADSEYNKCYKIHPKTKVQKQIRPGTIAKTDRILAPYGLGLLPQAVENLVRQYHDGKVEMLRYGVPRSVNSLIHCACIAIDDPNYMNKSEKKKEEYVTRIRQHILAITDPSLYKQELFDRTDEEIMDLLADGDVFLDPTLFFRGVEEIFRINIYTFVPPETIDIKDQGSIEVPRSKLFHARPSRTDRITVLIMKVKASEYDEFDYPQCELIIDKLEDNQMIRAFGTRMENECHEALMKVSRTITWLDDENILKAHENIYSALSYPSIIQYAAKSQFIDEYGKSRAITFTVQNKKGVEEDITMVTPPSQPENIPRTDVLSYCSHETAMDIFGQPSSATKNVKEEVVGLWFKIMDLKNGIYIPISTKPKLDLPAGPPNPIETSDVNVVERLHKLRKTLDFILQLIQWLFEIEKDINPEIIPSDFANSYFQYGTDDQEDTADYYDLSLVPRDLPPMKTVRNAIKYMNKLAPTLFSEENVILYSEEFFVRIFDSLKNYYNSTIGIPAEPKPVIERYYTEEKDFQQQDRVTIFMNENDYKIWLARSSIGQTQTYLVKSVLNFKYLLSKEPYMYQNTDGKIYIIQNVQGGDKMRALNVALTWKNERINLRNDAEPIDEIYVHVIYGISPSGNLVPIEDQSKGNPEFLRLLFYDIPGETGRYASMLEVL